MTTIVLHDAALDEGCYKVRLLLGALGLDYERRPTATGSGATPIPTALLRLNPRGTLPVLEEANGAGPPLVLRDAEAILAALALRHDPARTWLPADAAAFGATMEWLIFAARDLQAAVLARRHALFDEPADAPLLRAAARRAFRAMDDHMTARGFAAGCWFGGPSPTIADLALFPSFALSRDVGIEHEAYPALRRWMRRLRTIPGFQTMPGIPDHP